ncbi:MAG: c-type cytochrome [Burkholderiaceae bacterium]
MFSCRDFLAALALACGSCAVLAAPPAASAAPFPGIGRDATPKELAAWDIDVRPDFKGLPAGSGSVAKGMEVWESKCASCHGVFGESNEVFNPIVGGTTKEDIKTGHVARLMDRAYPGRTTLMKVATVSTLWDYIRRAMPWTAPKSLSTEEVYAVTAYILNLGGILPDDYVLTDRNIADVQKRMPNRNGMITDHALWPGPEFGRHKPDVHAAACMKDCAPEPKVVSALPDFARGSHGDLAEQNRMVGAQHGIETGASAGAGKGAPKASPPAAHPPAAAAPSATGAAALALLQKNGCTACHGIDSKIVGPGFADIARKYAEQTDAAHYLAGKIKAGGSGVWGAIPMPPQALNDADTQSIAAWLAGGAKP